MHNKIGQIVFDRRQQLSLTQEDLADMSNVALKTIYLLEQGKGNPSMKTMEKILNVLGLEMILQIKKLD